jgi:hypothetical protein
VHFLSPSRGIPRPMPESMGILHPGTSFGVFWSTNVARTWYRNVKYPLIPEKPGIRRGIPREGDSHTIGTNLTVTLEYILLCVVKLAY